MKIGICQVDGSIPNYALMKITGYYETKKDVVTWYMGNLFDKNYDCIYISKIFTRSAMPQLPSINYFLGGTGIDFYNKLPEEIESAKPSYSLFTTCNFHIGFSMKGCRYSCDFCCVPKKEGRPYVYSAIDDLLINPKGGDNLMLLDNDFFAGDWEKNLYRIKERGLKVCFCQGINIRIITEKQVKLLSECDYRNTKFRDRYITFAWDRYKDKEQILSGIARCTENGIPTKNMQFFILIGYDSTQKEDLERVEILRGLGCLPFVMPYNRDSEYQRNFSRWVNHRAIFKSVQWEKYKKSFSVKIQKSNELECGMLI